MKRNNKIIFFISIGIIVLFAIFGLKPYKKLSQKMQTKEDSIYVYIKDSKKQFSGCIIERKLSVNWAGTYLFTLSNGEKFSMSGSTINRDYKKIYQNLIRSLHVGDSIMKPQSTDSIYVFRNGQVYYYIIGKKIN